MRQAMTRTMAIEAPASKVLAYLARPENFPEWCRTMRGADARTESAAPIAPPARAAGGGRDSYWVDVDSNRGTVDFFFKTGVGLDVASARVIPVDGGAQVVLTVFEPLEECTDCGSLQERAAAAEAELAILKAFLESALPLKEETWH